MAGRGNPWVPSPPVRCTPAAWQHVMCGGDHNICCQIWTPHIIIGWSPHPISPHPIVHAVTTVQTSPLTPPLPIVTPWFMQLQRYHRCTQSPFASTLKLQQGVSIEGPPLPSKATILAACMSAKVIAATFAIGMASVSDA